MTMTAPKTATFGQQMAHVTKSRQELNPGDFEYRGCYYVGDCPWIANAYAGHYPVDCQLAYTYEALHKCSHCGTNHLHGSIFREKTTGQDVNVGNQCAGKFFKFDCQQSYLVAKAKRAEQQAKWDAENRDNAKAVLAADPELVEAFKTRHRIIVDIEARLMKWGKISPKQVALVKKIAADEAFKTDNPEPEAQPIPAELLDGRVEIAGQVLSTKWQESNYGRSYKMLVRDDRGFKVWGTVPGSEDPQRGDRFSFQAKVSRSHDDPCFGFFSRPTKAYNHTSKERDDNYDK